MRQMKDYWNSIIFGGVIFGMMATHLMFSDGDISVSERRKLEQMPIFTKETVLNGDFMEDMESYFLDQFPFRENFRKIKAWSAYHMFGQKDNNAIYVVSGYASKLEYPLRENSVVTAAQKFVGLKQKYFPDSKVYFSLIPDKNYFIAKENGFPSIDYNKMVEILVENLIDIEYINIFDTLTILDYYKTDSHWRQEAIKDTALKLAQGLGVSDSMLLDFEPKEIEKFYGVYYGQAALPMSSEKIVYLTNDVIQDALVYNYETGKTTEVYDLSKLDEGSSVDRYDIYLSGASPIIEIINESAKTDKELIIFRDSFGSSIAPYFISAYSKITLIDIRYISSDLLGDYVNFDNQDILFLYNSVVINNSSMLK